MQDFKVKAGEFEGPLDVLLALIEKRKLLINEVSLSQITDEYIQYAKDNEHVNMRNQAEFIVIASTLILIKSKSLLPSLELSQDEEKSIEELELRLKILQKIKSVEPHLREKFGEKISYSGHSVYPEQIVFTPSQNTSLEILHSLAKRLTSVLPKKEKSPEAKIKQIISLEEMIGTLTTRIQKNLQMSFKEFTKNQATEKVNIIVSFLALLELVKEGIVEANQKTKYDDINMNTTQTGTPNYS